MKVLAVVLGILVIIAGIFCAFYPGLTVMTFIWILGIAMVVAGISNLCTYSAKKKNGQATGWTIFGAIVSILLGLFIVFSKLFALEINAILIIFLGAWLFVYGIFTIIAACKVHSLAKENPDTAFGSNWGWGLALGIIMVLLGILILCNFFTSMIVIDAFFGILIGVSIIVAGINTIALAFTE